jgi:signal transduction histidine kinase
MFPSARRYVALAIFTIVLVMAVNLAWWVYYGRTEKLLDTQLSRRLTAVASAGAMMFDPAEVARLRAGDLNSFARVTGLLERLRLSDSLAEAFIIDENYAYLATTLTESDSVYFLAGLNGRFVDSAFFSRGISALATPSYETGSIYLKSAFAPLADSGGTVVAVLGVEANVDYFDSLTTLKRNLRLASLLSIAGGLFLGLLFLILQARMSKAEQQVFLGQTHAHMGRMVAVVAHEIKNPLQIIRASAERLRKKSGADEAGYIVEETDRLNSIVSGYLEFARGDVSLVATEPPTSFDLNDLLTSVRQHVTQHCAPDPVEWEHADMLPNPGGGTKVFGHPRSLRQILLNLLLNGAEACQAAGRPVRIGLFPAVTDSKIRLTITDYGVGLSKAELKRVFSPFYTTKQAGSGLGLYLTRKLLADMGGTIKIESRKAERTVVSIELPREHGK